jgi:hypothetical protein
VCFIALKHKLWNNNIPTIGMREVPSKNSLITRRKIMEYVKVGLPQFNGQNYAFWSRRMKTYMLAHGFDVWKVVVDGYTTPTTTPTDKERKKISERIRRIKIIF